MRWRRLLFGGLSVVVLQALLAAETQAAQVLELNGWHDCSMDVGDGAVVANVTAQCATVTMPLCHNEICSDSQGRTVELFVKRIAANSNTSTRNLWLLPDHPFAMSVASVERQMVLLHQQLQGDVSVYLMDQRGTGRSTLFDCDASQALSKSSPQGLIVAASEVEACAAALVTTFGSNFAKAFSLTSAARDVVTFISNFQAKTKVFLYGVGFGTHLMQRIMHFPSDEIMGFVFDSPATTAGGTKKQFPYRTGADKDFGDVGKAFLALCDRDGACAQRFDGKELGIVLQDLLDRVDQSSPSCPTIAAQLRNSSLVGTAEAASYGLRRLLATMMQELKLRSLIPVVVFRLNRCEESDVAVLSTFISRLQSIATKRAAAFANASSAGASVLVYDLIQFSELWETPSPSAIELLSRFTSTLLSKGEVYNDVERYCAFTHDTTSACNAYAATSGTLLSYSKDEFWNVAAPIHDQASVLMLSSRYDGETPLDYAQILYDALGSGSKEQLVFTSATHNVLANTPLLSSIEERSLDVTPSCAQSILASFLDNDGNLGSYDASCVAQLPGNVSFSVSATLSVQVLGVEDAYDGVLPSSSSGSGSNDATVSTPSPDSSGNTQSLRSSRNRYRAAFIVVLVLAILLLGGILLLWYRFHKKKLLEEEENSLRRMRGEGEEENDMDFLKELYNPSPTEWFQYRSNRMHL